MSFNDEKLKIDFFKSFGEEKWIELEKLKPLQAIILNNKYINDYEELLDSCLHELEHNWQRLYIASNDTPKARRWKQELENYNRLDVTQEIEIDDYINLKRILSDD